MTNGYPSPKIVLNITKIPIPAKKSGKVYNTSMRQTPLYILLRDILCTEGVIIFALDFVGNWYIMYKSYNGPKQPSQSEMSVSLLVHACYIVM